MQTSGIPARVAVPFADSGTKNTIPVPSQVAVTPGLASWTTGFPPLTMTPITAGGVPPYGADFNGILNSITNAIRWSSAGASYPFDATFASAVGGYPKGALIPNSTGTGYWLNQTENNSSNPEASATVSTGWVPAYQYGTTAITGLAATSYTLTTLQAAKPRITLAGTLTGNIALYFPTWQSSWTVVNNCTGNFSVTCKTLSGTGVAIPTGLTAVINGDGVNITQDANLLGVPGRLLNVQTFTSSGTYTPTAGTTSVIVEVQAGGGGGGGAGYTTSSNVSLGSGGGGGGYAKTKLTVAAATGATVTVGSGGAGGSIAPTSGTAGGNSSFGALCVTVGGAGGFGQAQATPPFTATGVVGGSVSTPTPNILSIPGNPSTPGLAVSTGSNLGGNGGSSALGSGGLGAGNNNVPGNAGRGYGGGGGAGVSQNSPSAGQAGSAGSPGIVVVWEYA